jgi:hypothetical protein
MPLTEADIEGITLRQNEQRARDAMPRAPEPAPGSFGAKQWDRQEIARLERVEAARGAEKAARIKLEAAERRRREEYQRNAPARAAAELAAVEEQIEELERRRSELQERATEPQGVSR